MTTELQQALLDDSLLVIQRKVALGSYPHSVYARALDAKAWSCAQWLSRTYPKALSAWDWHGLASNKNVKIDAPVVQLVHEHGLLQKNVSIWKNSAIAWEGAGVAFSLSFYETLWTIPGAAFKTRAQLLALGKMHRFEPINAWLSSERGSVEKEVHSVFKQLWEYGLLHCDRVLLEWLRPGTPRGAIMGHVHNCINTRSLALPSVLAIRANRIPWSSAMFLDQGLAGLGMPIEEFCQYVALYDASRLKNVWFKLETSKAIPCEWRSFLASGATLPVAGNDEQRLVMVLRSLFPGDEALRMQQCYHANHEQPFPQADLVDLL